MNLIPTRWSRASQPKYTGYEAGPTCILVVEDDLMIGAAAAGALEDAGFMVLTAASAEEAEVILSQEMVDVLFTDIDLGGRDGCDLAHRALKAQPGLPVILASGRSRRCHGDRIPAGARFLPKPYRLSQMVGEVHRAAQGKAAP
ncbi:response regulator [Microvirga sesbaniae]|uniref:response regulator n=1 Tax=Microvirga sesbaniae TaxID=681392 RepID=UPI0021C68FA5|nr:response regulator [Microvirga sp. HBU67692]